MIGGRVPVSEDGPPTNNHSKIVVLCPVCDWDAERWIKEFKTGDLSRVACIARNGVKRKCNESGKGNKPSKDHPFVKG